MQPIDGNNFMSELQGRHSHSPSNVSKLPQVELVSKKPSFKDPSTSEGPSKEDIAKKLNELNAALKETKTPTANATAPANTDNKSRTIGHYVVGKSLGEGTFGKVRLGTHTLTGEKVAIKILEKDKISDKSDIERVTREI